MPSESGLPDQATKRTSMDQPSAPLDSSTTVLARGRDIVHVMDHQFGIVLDERAWPTVTAQATNGLVDPVGGGALIHTGIAAGVVAIAVEARARPPSTVETDSWDEVVEISLVVDDASSSQREDDPLERFRPLLPSPVMKVGALMAEYPDLPALNPAGAGPYRVCVHARSRDHNIDGVDHQPNEHYLVLAWPGPKGPETVHKQTDRYGFSVRSAATQGS